ncbi:3'-5' exoribonuclease [Candidatus Pacearchaeota archaeon]|jgi:hypothetical protein|nr:3'-5' exoribonuclease [Candidatus Pacearchaeota archaeon]
MKYFIDSEFSERGPKHPIELISIAIVSEDGREFYAINSAWYGFLARRRASKWVQENVLSHLPRGEDMNMSAGGSPRMAWEGSRRMPISQIRDEILEFIGSDPSPEFWGYYADHDWVVFCQILGSMVDLPKGWPMFCMDLKQLCVEMGNPKMPDMPNSIEHHALYDARGTKYRYDWLTGMA